MEIGQYKVRLGDEKYQFAIPGDEWKLSEHDNSIHHYINFTSRRLDGILKLVSQILTNHYSGQGSSIKTWEKDRRMFTVGDSKYFNYNIIFQLIKKKGSFDPKELNLKDYGSLTIFVVGASATQFLQLQKLVSHS